MDCVLDMGAILEFEAQDENVVVSNKQMASKMLRGASVAPEKKSLVLFNAGGVPDPDRIEAVLRVLFPKMHEIEKRTGQAVPPTDRTSRPKALLRQPKAREVYEKEIEFEQEQDTTEKEDVLEVELSLEEDELVEDTVQDDSGVRGAHHAGLRHSQKMANIRKPRGLPGNVADTEDQFWRKKEQWCSR